MPLKPPASTPVPTPAPPAPAAPPPPPPAPATPAVPAVPPLLRIGGGLSARDGVHVQDLASRKRSYVDRRTLARTVAAGAPPQDAPALSSWLSDCATAPQPDAGHVEFWHRRKWRPSLEYHLASRDLPYSDSGPQAMDTRRRLLTAYGGAGALPPRLRPARGRRVALPEPVAGEPARPLGAALLSRRSVRAYLPGPTPAGALSHLLRTGLAKVAENQRRRGEEDPRDLLRSFGTAFDFYVLTYNVDGIDPAAWLLDLDGRDPAGPGRTPELIEVRPGDHRAAMREVFYGSPWPLTAAWTLVMVADFEQYQYRYRHERALRNLYIESGHLAQKLLLLADTHGLGTLVTPAVRDGLAEELLGLDPVRQATVYTLTMGPDPRRGSGRPGSGNGPGGGSGSSGGGGAGGGNGNRPGSGG